MSATKNTCLETHHETCSGCCASSTTRVLDKWWQFSFWWKTTRQAPPQNSFYLFRASMPFLSLYWACKACPTSSQPWRRAWTVFAPAPQRSQSSFHWEQKVTREVPPPSTICVLWHQLGYNRIKNQQTYRENTDIIWYFALLRPRPLWFGNIERVLGPSGTPAWRSQSQRKPDDG